MTVRKEEIIEALTHNCTNPPHFPPHCGCPAGSIDPGEPLTERIERTLRQLRVAGDEIKSMQQQCDRIDALMREHDARIQSERAVRMATLSYVWGTLTTEGHADAAKLVFEMIGNEQ